MSCSSFFFLFFFVKYLPRWCLATRGAQQRGDSLALELLYQYNMYRFLFLVPLSSEGPFAKCMLWVTMSCCRFNVLYIETRPGHGGRVKVGQILLISHKQNCYARILKDCTDLCAGSLVKLWESGYFRKKTLLLKEKKKKNCRTESQRWRTLN